MKRVLITGAASGLGSALATYYSQQGWSVCVADIQKQQGEVFVEQLNKIYNNHCFFLQLDVTSEAQWSNAVNTIKTRWHKLDCLINNAGVASSGDLDQLALKDFQWTIDINVMGTVKGCHSFIPMLKQNTGSIVNISSMAGFLHLPSMSAYNTSKAAILALSETLRAELNPHNVNISVACPAFFETNLANNMRATDKNSIQVVASLMAKSKINAHGVAKAIFEGMTNNKFYVFTHNQEKTLWRIKRFLPSLYFKIINKITNQIQQKKSALNKSELEISTD
ncbi:MAG: SDR family oxidoreductase [Saccharospirillaceae bacterium]|nr:SDR family oxidoreductase [Pseudomonadales bacterium]NRB80692.1 SDR family oxidoreductase [Saccharospirillaceae bacterium]